MKIIRFLDSSRYHKNPALRRTQIFLLLIFLLLAGIYGFYVYADARGVREWEETKKSLQTAGDNLDFNSYIPPKIPDDQNLGAIPLFKLEPEPSYHNKLYPQALWQAAENSIRDISWLRKGGSSVISDWSTGEFLDKDNIEKKIDDKYKDVFPRASQKLEPLEKLDALFPSLKELHIETAKRPLCRFEREYGNFSPNNPSTYGFMDALNKLCRMIHLHAIMMLNANRPDLALDDIKLILKLDSGLKQEPIWVSGIYARAMVRNCMGSIWEGLNHHVWTDSQLAELQVSLQEIDVLKGYQLSLRGDALGRVVPLVDDSLHHRDDTASWVLYGGPLREVIPPGTKMPQLWTAEEFAFWLLPNGTFDMAKARSVSFAMEAARKVVDLATHRVFPTKANEFENKITSLNPYAVPNLLLQYSEISPHGINEGSAMGFSVSQFFVDAAIIQCALERYRLAHGKYPESLNELRPYSNGPLPHDLINGEPYHYKLQPDGKFLLYSVGWNQVDDGGTIVYNIHSPDAIDREKGDWVWPIPKDAPHK